MDLAFIFFQSWLGKGIGKHLLSFVLSDLQMRGYSAVETFARKGSESNPAGPLEFYLRHGFFVKRERDEFPLVRKEFQNHGIKQTI